MGYYSDVLSAVIFGDAAHNTAAMVAWKLHCAAESQPDPFDKDLFGDNITFHTIGSGHPCILLRGERWKWYDSFRDVMAWTHFIEWMEEKHQAATVFIRIGEEDEDITREFKDSEHPKLIRFYAGDFFGVSREITCDI